MSDGFGEFVQDLIFSCHGCSVDTSALVKNMGWEMVAKEYDEVSKVGVAIFKKPADNTAYETREVTEPAICVEEDKADAAW